MSFGGPGRCAVPAGVGGSTTRQAAKHDAPKPGIARVLVMCAVDKVGSGGVIEANGGWLEDERNGKSALSISTDGLGS